MPNNPSGGGGATSPASYYPNANLFGQYQFISLTEVVNNFVATYVGEGKILSNTLKGDVNYHAHRALQELSYDTLKSCKSQEIEVCPNLRMPLPHDYVNYVKLTWNDANGIEHTLYPAHKTSNPFPVKQDANCEYETGCGPDLIQQENCVTSEVTCVGVKASDWMNKIGEYYPIADGGPFTGSFPITLTIDSVSYTFQNHPHMQHTYDGLVNTYCNCLSNYTGENCGTYVPSEGSYLENCYWDGWLALQSTGYDTVIYDSTVCDNDSDTLNAWESTSSTPTNLSSSNTTATDDDTYNNNLGQRYGIDPQFAQNNGSFYIECRTGMIYFDSNMAGRTVTLKYISDGHGTDDEMIVHKFAEEAMYKWIAYGCASARIDVPENVIQRLKKERFAETRKAKIRLSNVKIEEITQVMRGKSKWIKH